MHFSLSTSPKHKKEYSSDSSEKKYNLLHFRRISVLIELILAGKAKLSMASCTYIYLYNRGHCIQTPPRQRSADPNPVCHFDPLLMEIDVSYRAFGLVVN